jgi:2,4-dienoyl-CoA reductase-like NADH-dependent reductase (Old Yellow Enzyme family)/thioredoxin reductase
MTMNYATEEGFATSKLLDYYLERAKGGVGLIVVEGTFFQPEGRGYMNQLGLCSSEHVERLRSMTEAIHELKNDVKIFIQIHHAGWRAYSKITGCKPVGPSEVAPYPGAEIPHALTREEIDVLVQAHVKAAVRAREAGFDGVDIHCAHGYLIPSFFSLLSNQRTDAYGGDLAGRARFLLEIIRGIKEELGKEFPLTIKISGDEFIKGGLGLAEMTQIALLAQGAGIDGMMVSAGSVGGEKMGDLDHLHQVLRTLPMMTERGCLVPLAAEINKNLRIPVITVGRISTPALAEEILARGKADLVAMGRPLLADPYLPQKALEGNEALIRPCIACNEGCYKRIFEQLDIQCSVNPTLGREKDIPCPKASNPQKVVVVGAGPAGLEAAHAAWERGHKVILIEKDKELGGQLNLAAIPPGRKEIENFREYLLNRLKSTDVEMVTGGEATPAIIEKHNPDRVILAVGAHPQDQKIPGMDMTRATTAWEVLVGERRFEDPLLVLGAGLVGCEAADYLSEQGKNVFLVEILPEIANGADADTKAYFSMKFERNGVPVYTGAQLKRVEGESAVIQRGEKEIRVPFRTLVFALGVKPKDSLYEDLVSAGLSPIKIGDCLNSRRILDAVFEGFQAGKSI